MTLPKLLIYIVSYQRKSFTQGTIECAFKSKPKNAQIIVCDNGSTDGTREWLEKNQDKYELGLIFPEENLRVGGAWTLLTRYYDENDFDYVLPLDNDCWLLPDKEWFNQCLEIFNSDLSIGSLGLHLRPNPGHIETGLDPNYHNKKSFNNLEYYDTVLYAHCRLDKFSLWHRTMSNWPHKFIGDKIGGHYNSLGYRTLKIVNGFIVDISQYGMNNKDHKEYYRWFFKRERNIETQDQFNEVFDNFNKRSQEQEDPVTFTTRVFGKEFLKYLNKP